MNQYFNVSYAFIRILLLIYVFFVYFSLFIYLEYVYIVILSHILIHSIII